MYVSKEVCACSGWLAVSPGEDKGGIYAPPTEAAWLLVSSCRLRYFIPDDSPQSCFISRWSVPGFVSAAIVITQYRPADLVQKEIWKKGVFDWVQLTVCRETAASSKWSCCGTELLSVMWLCRVAAWELIGSVWLPCCIIHKDYMRGTSAAKKEKLSKAWVC